MKPKHRIKPLSTECHIGRMVALVAERRSKTLSQTAMGSRQGGLSWQRREEIRKRAIEGGFLMLREPLAGEPSRKGMVWALGPLWQTAIRWFEHEGLGDEWDMSRKPKPRCDP